MLTLSTPSLTWVFAQPARSSSCLETSCPPSSTKRRSTVNAFGVRATTSSPHRSCSVARSRQKPSNVRRRSAFIAGNCSLTAFLTAISRPIHRARRLGRSGAKPVLLRSPEGRPTAAARRRETMQVPLPLSRALSIVSQSAARRNAVARPRRAVAFCAQAGRRDALRVSPRRLAPGAAPRAPPAVQQSLEAQGTEAPVTPLVTSW